MIFIKPGFDKKTLFQVWQIFLHIYYGIWVIISISQLVLKGVSMNQNAELFYNGEDNVIQTALGIKK